MIVWLSSYPRSGNTLLRLMLKRVWGSSSYSVYDDRADIGADNEVSDAVGHRFLPAPWPVAYEQMKDSAEVFFVKTHDIPIDAGKAIYVVRDGRLASRSFWHYLNDFARANDEPMLSLAEVILGITPFGSWSDHLDGWKPQTRPDTLLLKFEDLVSEPQAQIERIGAFLERPPLEDWQNKFVELNQRNPKFFRAGSADAADAAMDPAEAELFWMVHGAWMRGLGYLQEETGRTATELPYDCRHAVHAAICNLLGRYRALEGRRVELAGQHENLRQELEASKGQLDASKRQIETLVADNRSAHERMGVLETQVQAIARSRAMRVMSILRLSPKVELTEAG